MSDPAAARLLQTTRKAAEPAIIELPIMSAVATAATSSAQVDCVHVEIQRGGARLSPHLPMNAAQLCALAVVRLALGVAHQLPADGAG